MEVLPFVTLVILAVEPYPRVQLAVEVALAKERQRPPPVRHPLTAGGVERVGALATPVVLAFGGEEDGGFVRMHNVGAHVHFATTERCRRWGVDAPEPPVGLVARNPSTVHP
jgi:hypothetical protein